MSSQDSEAIIWGEPPPRARKGRGPGHIARFVDQLKERPNQWAHLPKGYSNPASATSLAKRYPGVEATTRKLDDGRYYVWARWVELPGEETE